MSSEVISRWQHVRPKIHSMGISDGAVQRSFQLPIFSSYYDQGHGFSWNCKIGNDPKIDEFEACKM